jgi:hypothetical protein
LLQGAGRGLARALLFGFFRGLQTFQQLAQLLPLVAE